MDEKKILIINLSKGRVGEGNANLLGSMLITKIYLSAMSRADTSEKELAKLPNFYLYVDEFQSFANKSFADILSEARKYKLNLTIAHQYIEQMEEEVRDAVFGNVGTMITFRVGAFDAEVLEKEFAPTFEAADLVNLGFAQVYLKLMIDGVSSQPFSATTMGPIARPDISFRNDVITSSRSQFARPRAIVEKEIADWHEVVLESQNKPVNHQQNNQSNYFERNKSNDQKPRINNEVKKFVEPPIEKSKIDENKEVFLKATEELKKKNFDSKTNNEFSGKETISLSSLNSVKDTKKNPTKENISSLKDALSSLINKPKNNNKDSLKKETPINIESKNHSHHDSKEEEIKGKSSVLKNEVPENVLRELFNIGDNV